MTVCNMTIEAGARAGLISPDATTTAYLRGREFVATDRPFETLAAEWMRWASDTGCRYDRTVELRGEDIDPQVTWGTSPGMVTTIRGRTPVLAELTDANERLAAERALKYMGLPEMDFETRHVRQLTSGAGFADYEGIYLPDGNIMFSSTRCVQNVDCWHVSVSNMYLMNADGKHMRRVGFDQVHTNYPQVHPHSGLVTYTRWEYNDRGQIYPQPLFQMYPNGTHQTEYYGNNSYFPTTILHARGIPGTGKVLAVLSGHHTHQRMLVLEFAPSDGAPLAVVALALVLIWRRLSPAGSPAFLAGPVLVLTALAWVLGFKVLRFWLDWGLPALMV